MTVINTNVGALQARTYAVRADSSVTKAMERLSSGLRINSAADDAAGLAVANKMESQIRGMNMAIRNSQDGISLVQTAEAAMGEINNMVIRMRELAVQMNNGVYTDADRANAQLEVNALLSEIDKVANNSAFNQVKILDGTYSQDIRAGNTNPEVINVTIDRMNTDSLGGARVTRGVTAAKEASAGNVGNGTGLGSHRATQYSTEISIFEGRPVIDIASKLGGGDLLALGWTASVSANDAGANFIVDSANALTLNTNTSADNMAPELNYVAGGDNQYTVDITYTKAGDVTAVETVTINVEDRPVMESTASGSTSLDVEESACVKIYTGQTARGGAVNSVLSDQVKEFIESNRVAGNDLTYGIDTTNDDVIKGGFNINTVTGEITASLDFERPKGGSGDDENTYVFDVTVTGKNSSGTNVTYTEEVTVKVLDWDGAATTVVDRDDAVWAASSNQVTSGEAAVADDATGYASGNTQAIVGEYAQLSIAGSAAGTTANLLALSPGLEAFDEAFTSGTAGVFSLISVGDTAYGTTANTDLTTGVEFQNDGDIVVSANVAATTVEDIHIRFTATNGRTFDFFTDLTIAAGDDDISFTNAEKRGDYSSITVLAGGERATLDLTTTANNAFNEMATFYNNNPCGMFTIEAGTVEFNGSTTATATANLTVDNSGNVVLAEGADAGTYTATVYYEDNEGDTFVQRMDIIVSEVGIRGEASGAAGTAADTFAQVTQNNAAPAPTTLQVESQQVAGVSTINIEEARQGTIKSIGTDSVLNDEFTTFVGNNTGGTFALSGDDAELFTIDASTGDVATKGLVDYESKTSYSFNVVYTAANNSTYTEGVTLRVGDDEADNVSHIANVDLGTQDGAATAVGILDIAINQISSSQAKLGAIQNRLQYNIDNLSKATMLTQTAKGRIMDADFAAETSELSKQQILSQAATSMLAQANQSKQSVLALLQ